MFGPGVWVIAPSPALILPPEVEVRIAPGAKIFVLGAGSRLVIRGALTAPVGQVFELPRPDLLGIAGTGVGEVDLQDDRIECVHPEWWGAGRGDAEVDTQALQQAVHVAQRRSRPIPVELLGRYVLRRPLILSAPETSSDQGVELRGRFSSGGEPCLRASHDFEGVVQGEAMVIIPHTTQSALLHAVSMDGRGKAKYCIEARVAGSSVTAVTRAPHTLQQCAFGGATDAQVALHRFEPIVPAHRPFGVSHAPQLVATGCVFSPLASSVGVRLSALPDSVATLTGCTFAGEALAMVHVMGQGVTLTSCRFHNTLVPRSVRGVGGPIAWETVHQTGPEGGVDIFVDRETYRRVEAEPAPPTEPEGLQVTERVLVSPDRLLRQLRGALGWVSAQDCRSSSLQHVAVAQHMPLPNERAVRDSVLIGAHHACAPLPPPTVLARDRLPPAILWRAPAAQGGALSLTGCRFDGLNRMGQPRVIVVRGRGATPPALYEYGTCSRDRIVRTAQVGVDNSDVFSFGAVSAAIGYVPEG